jgi:enoyl-CoA hydratase
VLVGPLKNGRRIVTLNRPDRLNAITPELVDDLHGALDDCDRERECRVVILRGAGRAFCAGYDLRSDATGSSTDRSTIGHMVWQAGIADLVRRIHESRMVFIAAVRGAAAGGGFALATACDIRVISTDARFLAANAKVGLSGGEMGLSYLLPRLIGASRTYELLLTGRDLYADEAIASGYATRSVSVGELDAAAIALADQVVANSPFSTWMTKELMAVNLSAPSLGAALHLENRTQILCGYTEDMAEAVTAFREKRSPRWARTTDGGEGGPA